jgi:beta-galactosidase
MASRQDGNAGNVLASRPRMLRRIFRFGRSRRFEGRRFAPVRRLAIEPLESRIALAVGDAYPPLADPRVLLDATQDWKFAFNPSGTPQSAAYNDASWADVDLPHTWNAIDGQDGGSYQQGAGWYRKTLTAAEIAALAGRTAYIQFDGASMITDLFVDGVQLDFNPASSEDSHMGGFATFNFDVTAALAQGASHVLAVRTVNNNFTSIMPPQAGDFTKYGGLYRNVHFVGVDRAHITVQERATVAIDSDGDAGTAPAATNTPIATPGIYFKATNVSAASATVEVRTRMDNQTAAARSVRVHSVLVDAAGVIAAEHNTVQSLAAGAAAVEVAQSSTFANPHLWNGRIDPYLYDLYVEVRDATTDELVDLMHDRVGIRSFAARPYDPAHPAANGFQLNGADYDLHGVNYHQDVDDKGWAKSDADTLADLQQMAAMGVTVIRTSHYQHSQYFYDTADEMGFVIYTEEPVNGTGGTIPTTNPNMTTFFNNASDQLTELVRQNFNHPSVVFWGMHNEVAPSSGTQLTVNTRFLTEMDRLTNIEDPSRPTISATVNTTVTSYDRIEDTVAFNRYYGWYGGAPSDLAAWADQSGVKGSNFPVGLGEFGGGASIYQHTNNIADLMNNPNGQQWHPENYQAWVHEQLGAIIAGRPWLFAKTIWLMYDFGSDGRNEGTQPGINDKGVATIDRQTKDAYAFYQANWNDPERAWNNEKVLYIADWRWTDRHSNAATVKAYSNLGAPTVSLNGVVIGAMNPLVIAGLTIPNAYTRNVTLAEGGNVVQVTATHGAQNYTDSATWNYYDPSLAGTPTARIDFTNAPSNLQGGYAADIGQTYGVQSGGASYGWVNSATLAPATNSTGFTDAVGAAPFNELRYRSAIQLPTNRVWEIALPAGVYDVHVASADSEFTNMVNNMSLEGYALQDDDFVLNTGTPGPSPGHDEFYARVAVTDGRLTLRVGPGAANNRLAYIDVNLVQSLATLVAGDYNGDQSVDGADFLVWQQMLGQPQSVYSGADGNGNALVDAADLYVWMTHVGSAAALSVPASRMTSKAAPAAAIDEACASLAARVAASRTASVDAGIPQCSTARSDRGEAKYRKWRMATVPVGTQNESRADSRGLWERRASRGRICVDLVRESLATEATDGLQGFAVAAKLKKARD